MKKLIAVVFITLMSTGVMAQIKCESDGRGGTCCWDIRKDGPWKPIGC